MFKRDRVVSNDWEKADFAVVGVPQGDAGKGMLNFLKRQQLSGECRIEMSGNVMRHQDGRYYEDVVVHSTHRGSPEEIAREATAYLPDDIEPGGIGVACPLCWGKGCEQCGGWGVQGG